jgi:hypothetical protein
MRRVRWALASTIVALSAMGVSRAWSPADEQDTIRRTLGWSGSGAHMLELSNIDGSIHVVGYDGRDVEMVADRTIHADSDNAVSEAKRNASLEATENAGALRICADRDRCGCDAADHGTRRRWADERYRVDIAFELRVPKQTTLRLCTINHGNLTVEGTEGDFDVRHVNGDIEMRAIRGSGRAETVNGGIDVSFAANPKTASFFKTVNGDVQVAFPSDLAADLRLKTFNGGLYTDFDVIPLPPAAPVAERHNGLFVYRSNQFAAVRVGRGGPPLTFEGFNGDVRVVRQKQ